jgi:hypothetical protein
MSLTKKRLIAERVVDSARGKHGASSKERVAHAFDEIAESLDPSVTLGGLIFLLDSGWTSMRSAKFLNMSFVDVLRMTNSNMGDNVVVAVDDLLAEKILRPQLLMDGWSTEMDSLLALRFFTTHHVKFRMLIETVCEDMVEYDMADLAQDLSDILAKLDEWVVGGHVKLMTELFNRVVAPQNDDETMKERISRVKRDEMHLLQALSLLPTWTGQSMLLLRRVCAVVC